MVDIMEVGGMHSPLTMSSKDLSNRSNSPTQSIMITIKFKDE